MTTLAARARSVPWWGWAVAGVAGVGLVAWASTPRRRPIPGQCAWPPRPVGSQPERVVAISRAAERIAGMPGLGDWMIAKAYWESRYTPSAANFSDPAEVGYERSKKRYAANRFLDQPDRWSASLGAWQQMPHRALNTIDGAGKTLDPACLLDLPIAAALVVDDVVRGVKAGARTWSDLAVWWALPSAMDEPDHPSRGRFQQAVVAAKPRGVDQAIAGKRVPTTANYPGFKSMAEQLLAADTRAS